MQDHPLVLSYEDELADRDEANAIDAFKALAAIGSRDMAQTPSDAGTIIEAVMFVWNNYVVPYDLPLVPNFIEPTIDRALGEVLRQLLTAALYALRGVPDDVAVDDVSIISLTGTTTPPPPTSYEMDDELEENEADDLCEG